MFGGKVPLRPGETRPVERPYLIARIGMNRNVLLEAAASPADGSPKDWMGTRERRSGLGSSCANISARKLISGPEKTGLCGPSTVYTRLRSCGCMLKW